MPEENKTEEQKAAEAAAAEAAAKAEAEKKAAEEKAAAEAKAKAEAEKNKTPEQLLADKDKEIADLKKKIENGGGDPNVSVSQLQDQVGALTFERSLAKKMPHLADKADEIYQIQKKFPQMTMEEAVGHYLGQELIKSGQDGPASVPRPRSVGIPGGGGPAKDYSKMSDKELEAEALKELEAMSGGR